MTSLAAREVKTLDAAAKTANRPRSIARRIRIRRNERFLQDIGYLREEQLSHCLYVVADQYYQLHFELRPYPFPHPLLDIIHSYLYGETGHYGGYSRSGVVRFTLMDYLRERRKMLGAVRHWEVLVDRSRCFCNALAGSALLQAHKHFRIFTDDIGPSNIHSLPRSKSELFTEASIALEPRTLEQYEYNPRLVESFEKSPPDSFRGVSLSPHRDAHARPRTRDDFDPRVAAFLPRENDAEFWLRMRLRTLHMSLWRRGALKRKIQRLVAKRTAATARVDVQAQIDAQRRACVGKLTSARRDDEDQDEEIHSKAKSSVKRRCPKCDGSETCRLLAYLPLLPALSPQDSDAP